MLRPQLIESLFNFLLTVTPPIPFVFATASVEGKIPQELAERTRGSGRGIIVDWAPQVNVLRHTAVGMFLVRNLVCARLP